MSSSSVSIVKFIQILCIAFNRYDDAADTIRREICVNTELENTRQLGRLTVCLLLVQLARDDVVAAEKAYREFGGYCEALEAQTLELLLQVSCLYVFAHISATQI